MASPEGGASETAEEKNQAVRRPGSVLVVSGVVGLEAALVLLMAVFALKGLGNTATPIPVTGRVFLLVLLLGAAAWQLTVAVKHAVGRAWTRSAVVVWQLFQVIIGIYYMSNGPKFDDWAGFWIGVGLLVVGGVALVTVFSPDTRRWLEADDLPR